MYFKIEIVFKGVQLKITTKKHAKKIYDKK